MQIATHPILWSSVGSVPSSLSVNLLNFLATRITRKNTTFKRYASTRAVRNWEVTVCVMLLEWRCYVVTLVIQFYASISSPSLHAHNLSPQKEEPKKSGSISRLGDRAVQVDEDGDEITTRLNAPWTHKSGGVTRLRKFTYDQKPKLHNAICTHRSRYTAKVA